MEKDRSGKNAALNLAEMLTALGADEKQAEKIVRVVDFVQARCKKKPWSPQMIQQMALLGTFTSQIPDFRIKRIAEINDEFVQHFGENFLETPILEYSQHFRIEKPQSATAIKYAFRLMILSLQGKITMAYLPKQDQQIQGQ